MPTRTDDVLTAYAAHLRTTRHASPHTIRAYLADLRQFLAFAGEGIASVGPETLRHWLPLLDRTTEPSSIARKLAAVGGLLRSPPAPAPPPADPPAGVPTPKPRRKLPAHLTLDDIDRLL